MRNVFKLSAAGPGFRINAMVLRKCCAPYATSVSVGNGKQVDDEKTTYVVTEDDDAPLVKALAAMRIRSSESEKLGVEVDNSRAGIVVAIDVGQTQLAVQPFHRGQQFLILASRAERILF